MYLFWDHSYLLNQSPAFPTFPSINVSSSTFSLSSSAPSSPQDELSTSRQLRQGEPSVQVAQDCPGRPLQLEQVLDGHLRESVGAVNLEKVWMEINMECGFHLHDEAHHDCDQHLDQAGNGHLRLSWG